MHTWKWYNMDESNSLAHHDTTDNTAIRQARPKWRAMAKRNKHSKVAPGLSQIK